MKNAIIAALVSALVAVGIAGAHTTPVPYPMSIKARNTIAGPSYKQYSALQARVGTLEKTLACFYGGEIAVTIGPDPEENLEQAQAGDPQAYVPTIDNSCVTS